MASGHNTSSEKRRSVSRNSSRENRGKDVRKRNNDSPVPIEDTPANGNEIGAHNDHSHANCQAERKSEPEALQDFGHFEPEVRAFNFLLGGAPCDVVGEEVGKEGLGKMDTETTEEESAAEERRLGPW